MTLGAPGEDVHFLHTPGAFATGLCVLRAMCGAVLLWVPFSWDSSAEHMGRGVIPIATAPPNLVTVETKRSRLGHSVADHSRTREATKPLASPAFPYRGVFCCILVYLPNSDS